MVDSTAISSVVNKVNSLEAEGMFHWATNWFSQTMVSITSMFSSVGDSIKEIAIKFAITVGAIAGLVFVGAIGLMVLFFIAKFIITLVIEIGDFVAGVIIIVVACGLFSWFAVWMSQHLWIFEG